MQDRREQHPNRAVHRDRFLPSAPDTHTTTVEDAGAYASNNLSRQDLLGQIANHKGPKPNWMYREMGYDD